MKTSGQPTADQVKAYCTIIGADPLLVQGAGGNVSWKEGDVLWVKASGTWLAQADNKDIFIPVDLAHLNEKIAKKNFSATPKVLGFSILKPSIETMLHALMPHKIVVHLHAVEILAHLVRENPLIDLKKIIDDSVKWILVDYFKPGSDLAQAVFEQLAIKPDADVVFLKSHGLVIGGADIQCIQHTLAKLIFLLQTKNLPFAKDSESRPMVSKFLTDGYVLSDDSEVNLLATNKELALRTQADWALYPDHVVFLGDQAFIINEACDLSALAEILIKPNFIFIIGQGVYESKSAAEAHKVQLRCYFEVITRQLNSEILISLTKAQVTELLNWDAEKYRQQSLSNNRRVF